MNIFFLSWILDECARWHVDKHVVKMILETTQLLSTAHHILDPVQAAEWMASSEPRRLYRKTHANHPSAVWVRAHVNNYNFLAQLGLALCREYTVRYNKTHACQRMLEWLRNHAPANIPQFPINANVDNPHGLTVPVPQAMPETLRVNDQPVCCVHCKHVFRVLERPTAQTAHSVTWTCAQCNQSQETALNVSAILMDTIDAYRAYYQCEEKRALASWKCGDTPHWYVVNKRQRLFASEVHHE